MWYNSKSKAGKCDTLQNQSTENVTCELKIAFEYVVQNQSGKMS